MQVYVMEEKEKNRKSRKICAGSVHIWEDTAFIVCICFTENTGCEDVKQRLIYRGNRGARGHDSPFHVIYISYYLAIAMKMNYRLMVTKKKRSGL